MKPVIYLISGLGADERAFGKIRFGDYETVPLKWIKPLKKESLADYALRLSAGIDRSRPVIIVGVSLGGMMAMEISRQIQTVHTIIISSIKTKEEEPAYFRWFRWFPVYKLIPNYFLVHTDVILRFLFPGAAIRKWGTLFMEMLRANDPVFLKWAMGAALHFSNPEIPPQVSHIHGTSDHVFPHLSIKNYIPVKHGSHVMVFTRGAEIGEIIRRILNEEAPAA
jgi:pimeloyl-ACP methyl ester carboxylesterase